MTWVVMVPFVISGRYGGVYTAIMLGWYRDIFEMNIRICYWGSEINGKTDGMEWWWLWDREEIRL